MDVYVVDGIVLRACVLLWSIISPPHHRRRYWGLSAAALGWRRTAHITRFTTQLANSPLVSPPVGEFPTRLPSGSP